MGFISYAQNFEDVMLWRALKDIKCGFYIDVGANDPDIDSVTKIFYEHGWCGINIEPVQEWFDRLAEKRQNDINLQVGAGAQSCNLPFYELQGTGISTFDKSIAERHEENGYIKIERSITVETLTSICQRYHVAPIHFLKIDVEGAEKEVLQGLDLTVIRPWIILVESTLPNSQVENYNQWESIILSGNYDFVYFDGLNRFYLANEHEALKKYFQVPPNVFDGFCLSGLANHPFYKLVESRAEQAELTVHKLTDELQVVKDELQAVYVSRSWRVTEPLRWVVQQAILFRQHGLIARMKVFGGKMLALLVRPILSFVHARSGLGEKFVGMAHMLGCYKPLQALYWKILGGHSLTTCSLDESIHFVEEDNIGLVSMTPHARSVYIELKKSIEKNRGAC